MTNVDDGYRLLQQHLDKQAVGFPPDRSGADIRFLKRLFAPDEAKLALHLSYKPTPLRLIVELAVAEFSAAEVERLLDNMFMKGAIGRKEKDGVCHWHVMPLLVGMYEAQDGKPSPEFLADAGAYMKTRGFMRAFLSVSPSQMRTIPINKSLSVEHHVATYDNIRDIVQNSPGPFVVLKCICREAAAMREKPCLKTSREETCLGFNDMAAMVLRRNHGREVSRDEVLDILRQNEDDGLVLQPANAQQPEFVCSCCGCCCGMLSFQKFMPRPLDFWTSDFFASVTTEECVHCSECVSRCQVNAATLTGPDGTADIDIGRCIGCGLCVSTCPSNALQLKKKVTEVAPPKDEEQLYDEIMANKKGPLEQWGTFIKTGLKMMIKGAGDKAPR